MYKPRDYKTVEVLEMSRSNTRDITNTLSSSKSKLPRISGEELAREIQQDLYRTIITPKEYRVHGAE